MNLIAAQLATAISDAAIKTADATIALGINMQKQLAARQLRDGGLLTSDRFTEITGLA